MADETLLLASKSPIRAELLRRAGLAVEIRPAAIDERAAEAAWAGAGPPEIACRLAEAKALAVSHEAPGRLVLGADQTLDLDGIRFTKSVDRAAARRTIERLSGRTHRISSGFALARDGAVIRSGVAEARLAMRPLSPGAIERYLDRAGETILGSVGCYQLEALGAALFERVEGDFFTVLGLPLLDVLAALRAERLIEE